MNLYKYHWYNEYRDLTVGIVMATSREEAEKSVRKKYSDLNVRMICLTVKEIDFDDNGTIEIHYEAGKKEGTPW